jgi:hypothetical protein
VTAVKGIVHSVDGNVKAIKEVICDVTGHVEATKEVIRGVATSTIMRKRPNMVRTVSIRLHAGSSPFPQSSNGRGPIVTR